MKNIPVNYGKKGYIAISGENVRNKERFQKYAKKMKALEIEKNKKIKKEEVEEAKFNM